MGLGRGGMMNTVILWCTKKSSNDMSDRTMSSVIFSCMVSPGWSMSLSPHAIKMAVMCGWSVIMCV